MDLEAQMHAWFPALRAGDLVLPGVTFERASVELGPQLVFRTSDGPLCVEVFPRAHASRFAVADDVFALSYRAGTGDGTVDPALGKRLCEVLLEQLQRRVIAPVENTHRIRDVRATTALQWRELGEQSHYTLTPYVGCTVGCRFCYAQSRLAPARQLSGLPQLRWGEYVDALSLIHI